MHDFNSFNGVHDMVYHILFNHSLYVDILKYKYLCTNLLA